MDPLRFRSRNFNMAIISGRGHASGWISLIMLIHLADVGRSQLVVATLARSLLIGVYEGDFVHGRWFKRNPALFKF
jgi:hypothetical protein